MTRVCQPTIDELPRGDTAAMVLPVGARERLRMDPPLVQPSASASLF